MVKEVPASEFHDPDGVQIPNLSYVNLPKEGAVTLAGLREACLEQLPDDMAPQVEEWIQHQKNSGGATDDTEVFEDNGVSPVLHITFVEDTNGEMQKQLEAAQ
jgi:hypothetical protein